MTKKDNEKKVKVNEVEQEMKIEEQNNQEISAEEKVIALENEKKELQDRVTRALADYQNLVRRQKEEQGKVVEYAKIMIFESLLQPLEHLAIAAKTLNDKGLNMVIDQFWKALEEQGLKEFNPINQEFDPLSMEVIEKVGSGEIVAEVASPGYMLNNQVIKFAKVKVGQ